MMFPLSEFGISLSCEVAASAIRNRRRACQPVAAPQHLVPAAVSATHGGEYISLHHAFATVFVRWVFPFGFFRPDFPQHLKLSRRRKVPVVIGDEGFSFSAWWGLNCEDLLQSF